MPMKINFLKTMYYRPSAERRVTYCYKVGQTVLVNTECGEMAIDGGFGVLVEREQKKKNKKNED